MKIEHVEVPLDSVLKFFQQGFKLESGGKISYFGKPVVDTAQGVVVFRLHIENDEDWNRRHFHNEVLSNRPHECPVCGTKKLA